MLATCPKKYSQLIPCVISIMILLALGCSQTVQDGRPARAKVTGSVSLGGGVLSGTNVLLHSQSDQGQDAVGKTEADGTFTLTTFTPGDGALPGEYKVTVSKVETVSAVTEEQAQQLLSQGRPVPPPKNTELVPKKYTNMSLTPLTFTVEAGIQNKLDINLEN